MSEKKYYLLVSESDRLAVDVDSKEEVYSTAYRYKCDSDDLQVFEYVHSISRDIDYNNFCKKFDALDELDRYKEEKEELERKMRSLQEELQILEATNKFKSVEEIEDVLEVITFDARKCDLHEFN